MEVLNNFIFKNKPVNSSCAYQRLSAQAKIKNSNFISFLIYFAELVYWTRFSAYSKQNEKCILVRDAILNILILHSAKKNISRDLPYELLDEMKETNP